MGFLLWGLYICPLCELTQHWLWNSAQAIVFLVPLAFNQMLEEDHRVNRLVGTSPPPSLWRYVLVCLRKIHWYYGKRSAPTSFSPIVTSFSSSIRYVVGFCTFITTFKRTLFRFHVDGYSTTHPGKWDQSAKIRTKLWQRAERCTKCYEMWVNNEPCICFTVSHKSFSFPLRPHS